MKYIHEYTLLLMLVFHTSCGGQNQTNVPKDNISSDTQGIITLRGPATSVRTIVQDRKGNIWLASNEGIIRYDGKYFTNITGNTKLNFILGQCVLAEIQAKPLC